MSARGGKLVATNEPTVGPEPFLDAIVVEGSQSDGCFPDPSYTDKGNWSKVFCKTNDLRNQFLTPKADPRRRGR